MLQNTYAKRSSSGGVGSNIYHYILYAFFPACIYLFVCAPTRVGKARLKHEANVGPRRFTTVQLLLLPSPSAHIINFSFLKFCALSLILAPNTYNLIEKKECPRLIQALLKNEIISNFIAQFLIKLQKCKYFFQKVLQVLKEF